MKRFILAILSGAGTWVLILALALVIDMLWNSGGQEQTGFVPILPAAAVLLGWIPSLKVAAKTYRSD